MELIAQFLQAICNSITSSVNSDSKSLSKISNNNLLAARESANRNYLSTGATRNYTQRNILDNELNRRSKSYGNSIAPTYHREHAGIYKED